MFRNILLFIAVLLSFRTVAQNATEIIKKADEKSRGKTSIASITIQIIRPNWTREMKIKAWTKGNDFSMIMVNEPVKDKGVVYLKRKKEVWNWIPSVERTIKLPPSMMSQSWMGTDFTNDDLVKEASIVEDYTHRITGDTTIDGRICYKIQLLPKPESAVVWGKLFTCIDKKDNLMLYVEYYDEDNKLINTLKASEVKMLGDRLLPSRMEMVPAEKKYNKTVLIYNSLLFDKPIDDNFFTPQNMPKVK